MSKTVEHHFLDPTSDGGVGERWLRRRALESNGLGSDPDGVTLGQLGSSLLIKGGQGSFQSYCILEGSGQDRVCKVPGPVSRSWSALTACLVIRALRLGLRAGGVVYV